MITKSQLLSVQRAIENHANEEKVVYAEINDHDDILHDGILKAIKAFLGKGR
jgi:hypothetical protein